MWKLQREEGVDEYYSRAQGRKSKPGKWTLQQKYHHK